MFDNDSFSTNAFDENSFLFGGAIVVIVDFFSRRRRRGWTPRS